ncbi:MAG: Crp/Fnr family transcriptional regulator [Acetobacteraceae bacterium]|nr:Crp/Fnr family transcriptional regulator [Acetobacteraceae bacterium]
MPSAPPPKLDPASLAASPLFAGLSTAAVEEAADLGRVRRVPRDHVLFEQGAPADALHLVLAGRLRVARGTDAGERQVLRFVGPGLPAGVLALLGADQHYPATASAAGGDAVVLSWEGAALRRLAERHPALLANAMRALSGRAQEAHERLAEMAAEPVERRLARALLRLVRDAADGAGGAAAAAPTAAPIRLAVSRQELADMAGTTLATASRVLSRWRRAGVLGGAPGRVRVEVREPATLARLAEGGGR